MAPWFALAIPSCPSCRLGYGCQMHHQSVGTKSHKPFNTNVSISATLDENAVPKLAIGQTGAVITILSATPHGRLFADRIQCSNACTGASWCCVLGEKSQCKNNTMHNMFVVMWRPSFHEAALRRSYLHSCPACDVRINWRLHMMCTFIVTSECDLLSFTLNAR